MRSSAILVLILAACSSPAKRTCRPVPSFSGPAGECVALAEPAPPPPRPEPKRVEKPVPEPEPEPTPEPVKEPEPPPPVVVTADKIELDRTVQFESGKAKLVEDSRTLLGDVAKVLEEHPELALVQIEGHTDAVGSTRKNKKLSTQRATAVRAFLIKAGIAKKRLVAKGFGEAKPVADNGTEDGRFKNRRVDLKILKRTDAVKTDDEADDEAEKPAPAKKKPKP